MTIPLGRVLFALIGAWGAGLVWFCADALQPSPPPANAGGIVVLTGDSARVETALALLDQGRATLLLVSGAGPRVSLNELAHRQGRDPAALSGKVTLGRTAVSTWGNGAEFAAWAAQHQITSAIVVTSFYHMRRGLLELHRAAPNIRLQPVKVPAQPHLGDGNLRKLVDDYNKYLLAIIGLSRFSPGHRAA